MALRKCNIVAYTTSDGQKFIGGETKTKAEAHEKKIQEFLKEVRTARSVFEIIGIEECLKEIDDESILAHFYDMAKDDTDSGMQDRFEDIVDNEMEKMLQEAQCADDLSGIDDMLDMICDVIDSLGGINPVVMLYAYHTKRRKS